MHQGQEQLKGWAALAAGAVGGVVWCSYLGGSRPDGGDAGRVNERLGPARRLFYQALPLAGQPCELLLMLVEACVYAVLEVGWGRDLHSLLLLSKHGSRALAQRVCAAGEQAAGGLGPMRTCRKGAPRELGPVAGDLSPVLCPGLGQRPSRIPAGGSSLFLGLLVSCFWESY